MGVYRSVSFWIEGTNLSVQFNIGEGDDCQSYSIGDEIDDIELDEGSHFFTGEATFQNGDSGNLEHKFFIVQLTSSTISGVYEIPYEIYQMLPF